MNRGDLIDGSSHAGRGLLQSPGNPDAGGVIAQIVPNCSQDRRDGVAAEGMSQISIKVIDRVDQTFSSHLHEVVVLGCAVEATRDVMHQAEMLGYPLLTLMRIHDGRSSV